MVRGPWPLPSALTHCMWLCAEEVLWQCIALRWVGGFPLIQPPLQSESHDLYFPTQSCTVETSLVGHAATVTRVLFTSLEPLTVITLSEDRTFKV